MSLVSIIAEQLETEAASTKKYLLRVPEEKLAWKPHEKSTPLGRLAMHIAELPVWITRSLSAEEFDFAREPFKRVVPDTHAQIMDEFEAKQFEASELLKSASDEFLMRRWTLRRGEQVIFEISRALNIQRALTHISHHRGQLSVYLRLLDVPLPNIFGPTADER